MHVSQNDIIFIMMNNQLLKKGMYQLFPPLFACRVKSVQGIWQTKLSRVSLWKKKIPLNRTFTAHSMFLITSRIFVRV